MQHHRMQKGRLHLLEDYEITREPVMGSVGLRWAPYVTVAVAPYRVTAVPQCDVGGLSSALVRAKLRRLHEACRADGVIVRQEVGLVAS
jgi:hypothetical protein